ncbi:MAG: class I SAM-dependent methyltransferase [Bacteroidota bacterium]
MEENFFYNDLKNVLDYIRMAEPYDGKILIDKLENFLPDGSSVLELGMGPGKDMNILSKRYNVTGSDLSGKFIDLYLERNPGAEVLVLDAVTIEISKKFNCIFSNKTLHHLSREDLSKSLIRQHSLLTPRGYIIHSFWEGDREEVLSGLRFVYYRKKKLESIFAEKFKIINSVIYSEVFPDDSILILAQKRE